MADSGSYYIEKESSEGPTRVGPYHNETRAKMRHNVEMTRWKDGGKKGKKPELTIQPAGWKATPGMTTPTHRESPRTGKTGKATLPGVPSYHKGDDTKRGA